MERRGRLGAKWPGIGVEGTRQVGVEAPGHRRWKPAPTTWSCVGAVDYPPHADRAGDGHDETDSVRGNDAGGASRGAGGRVDGRGPDGSADGERCAGPRGAGDWRLP